MLLFFGAADEKKWGITGIDSKLYILQLDFSNDLALNTFFMKVAFGLGCKDFCVFRFSLQLLNPFTVSPVQDDSKRCGQLFFSLASRLDLGVFLVSWMMQHPLQTQTKR
ncbi:hypothetical protein RJ641_031794 [Dillenia turbinata]|uniref:Uncharacterized protein n=1 Tax=Dillenia turbinata TaxID=194707 RepID=A0AAN8VY86_9MAGN